MPKPDQYWDVFLQRPIEAGNNLLTLDETHQQYLVGPAFFDPQVNGFGGIDFQDPNLTLEGLEHAGRMLQRTGCSHFLVTLITADHRQLGDQVRRIAEYLRKSPLLRAMIPGIHLEGPFISAMPGVVGAHPPEHTADPDWNLFEYWQEASGGLIRMMTLASERPGSLYFIRRCRATGVWICLGHTAATWHELQQAVQAGAQMFTHLGNGCAGTQPRHDNIIQNTLGVPSLMASVIPDGIHVPPPALRNLLKQLGPSRCLMTTDAMSAAGAPSGRYRLGQLEVEIGEDRIVRNPNGHGFAGSSLTPVEGFYNAIRIGGLGVEDSWRAWTMLRDLMFPELQVPRIALPFPSYAM